MFYYLPERVYDAVKDSQKLKELEDKFTELNKTPFDYSPELVDQRYKTGFHIQHEVAKRVKNAAPEIIREFKIILSYDNAERMQEFLKTETDPENRLYLYQSLSNCGDVNIGRIKNSFIYEYNQLTPQQKAELSPILHSTYLNFAGEKIIASSVSLLKAVKSIKALKDELLRIPVRLFPNKHNKMLAFNFLKLMSVAYQQYRHTAASEEIIDMLSYVMDMNNWHDKVYDDIWIGNFCVTELLYNVLFDCSFRADKEGMEFTANVLASYLVTAFTNLDITIKTLTSNDAEFRMNFLSLAGACIRLLERYDKELVEKQVLPAAPAALRGNLSAYNDIESSETPISDFMGMQVNYEHQLIKTTAAEIELKTTGEYKLLQNED